MVRGTRTSKKVKLNEKENVEMQGDVGQTLAHDMWSLPNIDGGRTTKPTMIMTYSKKRPLKITPLSKPQFPVTTDNQRERNKQRKRKQADGSPEQVETKKPNKTTISPGSMVLCTMRENDVITDDVFVNKQMTMCSMSEPAKEKLSNMHNSTLITANSFSTIADYVPDDISIINGDLNQLKLVSSFCNEKTPPMEKAVSAVKSSKKVQFSVALTGKTKQVPQSYKRNVRRSILKTPAKSVQGLANCSNKQTNIDKLDTMEYNSYESQEIDKDNGEMTEKLLDFEPLPLECSDANLSNHRDITPETSTSIKPTSSGKECRRLSFLPLKTDPVCFLLDFPVSKPKTTKVHIGQSQQKLSIKEMTAMPTDILLCL